MSWIFGANEASMLLLAGTIGGAFAGMLIMFYWHISPATRDRFGDVRRLKSAQSYHLRLVLPPPNSDRIEDLSSLQSELLSSLGPALGSSQGDEITQPEHVSGINRAAMERATMFSLGAIVLSLTGALVPMSQSPVAQASWTVAGVGLGAAFQHAVWLFVEANRRIHFDTVDVEFTEVDD